MAKLPTFTKWSMAFINFIRDFIKSNSRSLIGGTIFVCVYVILPMFYSSLDGSMWTGKYAYNWLLGIYPALIILGFLCTKPTQSANGGESATSGFKLGIIPTLPLLVSALLIIVLRFAWIIFTLNFQTREPFVLVIIIAFLFPVPFVGGLGGMIKNLYFRFKPNKQKSPIESLIQIAEQGDVQAQLDLARTYYDGKDTPQDYIETAKWLTKAANQGDAEAQCGLGIIYFDGLGTEKDYKTASEWWTKAANQGYERAQKNLEVMHAKGLIPKWVMPTKETE